MSNLSQIRPSAQPDGNFGKWSLLMIHLLINLYIYNIHLISLQKWWALVLISCQSYTSLESLAIESWLQRCTTVSITCLNVSGFIPIKPFTEIILCCLGQKCLLFSIIKGSHIHSRKNFCNTFENHEKCNKNLEKWIFSRLQEHLKQKF